MDGLIVFAILLGVFYFIAPIVALVMVSGHSDRLRRLAADNAGLRARLDNLERRAVHIDIVPAAEPTPEPPGPAPVEPTPPLPESLPEAVLPPELDNWAAAAEPPPAAAAATPPKPAKPFDWERFIGVRLPVWLGALALSLAGFFFVRYAIEAGLITPALRVFGALLAAFGFLVAAEIVRRHITTDNGPAIAAALAAAGIATLYATAYLASVVYALVPLPAGFVAMAVVTVLSVVIALVFGQAVAVVGMLGGYLTPALVPSDEPSAAILFAYLTAILIGMFVLIRRKAWWSIAPVALLGPLFWIVAWANLLGFEADHLWGSAFLFAIALTALIATYPEWSGADHAASLARLKVQSVEPAQVALMAIAVSSFGFLVFLARSDHTLPFWQAALTFATMSAALAFIWPIVWRYAVLPPLVALSLAMLGWENSDPVAAAVIIPVAATIFAFTALDQFRRMLHPVYAAGLISFVSLFFYLMALGKAAGWQSALDQPHLWALGALVLAVGLLALLWRFGPLVADERARSHVYAILASSVTAFVALVIVLELDPLYYPIAAALQVLGLAYVHRRTSVPALRFVAMALSAIYVLLLLGAFNAAAPDAFMFDPTYVFAQSLTDAPLVLLILPGLAFLGAGYLFRRDSADVFADCLDIGGLAVAALGLLVLGGADRATIANAHDTVARIAAPELLLAAAAIYVGRRWARPTLYIGGLVLSALSAVAMALTVVVPLYSFWPPHELSGIAVFNIALLSLGLPSLVLLAIGWYVRQDQNLSISRIGIALSIAAVCFLFTVMILDIRHAYHPQALQGPVSDAESYSYSVGMLLFGAILLIIGVAIRNLGARILSFVFVLAATVKVFLFDAADLEGLWRVLSFFGMGLSFLAISWLYARFVFGLGRKVDDRTSPAT